MAIEDSIRLSELSTYIRQAVDNTFNNKAFWVIGEVANHSFRANKNYHYFDLIEKNADNINIAAKIPARAWSEASENLKTFENITGQRFTNDIKVLLKVSVSYSSTFGIQLNLIEIDAGFTIGELEQQRRETLQRLVAENPMHVFFANGVYLTTNKKLKLPSVIQNIAVISSEHSAGLDDFEHTLKNTTTNLKFYLTKYLAPVQGELNATLLVERLIQIYNSQIRYDAVVIIRGGGAQTDLILFDQYVIGRAIARFPIPIITGIGHQRNETIADLMANTSVKTPTQAAEFIINHDRQFLDHLILMEKNVIIRAQRILNKQQQQMAAINSRLVSTVKLYLNNKEHDLNQKFQASIFLSRSVVNRKKVEIELLQKRITSSCLQFIKNQEGNLDRFEMLARLTSPNNLLKKGFALIKQNGHIITNAEGLSSGIELSIILGASEISVITTEIKPHERREFNI
jgi:exodeoxyribonuclease VII large subunit